MKVCTFLLLMSIAVHRRPSPGSSLGYILHLYDTNKPNKRIKNIKHTCLLRDRKEKENMEKFKIIVITQPEKILL